MVSYNTGMAMPPTLHIRIIMQIKFKLLYIYNITDILNILNV